MWRKLKLKLPVWRLSKLHFNWKSGRLRMRCLPSTHGRARTKRLWRRTTRRPLELIFAHGYECCAFKNNICGDQLEVLDGMPDSSNPLPPEFFMNPRCPPAYEPTEATSTEAEHSEMVEKAKEPEKSPPFEDFTETS